MTEELLADKPNLGLTCGGSKGPGRLAGLLAGLCSLAVLGGNSGQACFGQLAPATPQAVAPAADVEPADPIFMPAKRSIVLLLERTEQLLSDGRYAEAVQCLDRILSGNEDFFFKPDAETSVHQSIKSEARRLLGTLPPGGRQSYELQFGALARSTLESAVETGNISMVAEVARRFFHTDAGYEASFLLGLHHLDHGRPLVAALTLRRLRDEATSSERFEPALSLAMARNWLDAGMPEDAREALESLRDRYADRTVMIEGRQVPLFAAGVDPVQWLKTALGPDISDASASPSDWTMHGGSPQRMAVSSGGRPLLNSRWYVRSTEHPAVEAVIDQLERQQEDRQTPLCPGVYPLVVDNVVLTRTTTNLLAVDFQTGKRLWEVPVVDPLEAALNPPPDGYTSPLPDVDSGLRLRLWGDQTFGTLSSDGRLVFAVEDLPLPTDAIYSAAFMIAGNRGPQTNLRTTNNRLAAFEIRSEGKLRWELGGPHSENPLPLAGAFFLGPPLPLLGDLYVLAEIDGEIRLLALKAESGELLWQQQLAVVDQSIFHDLLRRVSGVSPSYGDGILICPTSNRSVVALDLTTRSLLWGYSYADVVPADLEVPNRFRAMRNRTANPENRWTDSSAVVADGRVLCTPPDSDQLHCLNLRDGRLLWRVPREDKLFVAAMAEGKLVVAARKGLTALNLENGQPAWETPLAACPPGSEPTGQGYSDGEVYYLPLTSGKLMAVRLATGQVEQVIRSRNRRSLGNLVCHDGKILSQRADGIESYDQLETLRAEVDGLLAARPEDPRALALRGEILWDDGKLDDAVDCLRQSLRSGQSPHARSLLRQAMFDGLEKEFARYQAFRDEIETLLETPDERATLHRLMAVGWDAAGQYDRALGEYRALVDLAVEQNGVVEAEEDYWVREDRWIQTRLHRLYESAPEDVRNRLVRWSEEALGGAQLAGKTDDGRVLRCFDGLPGTADYKTAWIERLVESGRLSEAELAMRGEIESSGGGVRGQRLARWTTMLLDAGRVSDAASLLAGIEKRWADVPFPEGLDGRQWATEFTERHEAVRQVRQPADWPRGHVKTAVKPTEQGSVLMSYVRGLMPFQNRNGLFFEDLAIELQPQHIAAKNGLGQTQWRFPLGEVGELGQLAAGRGMMPVGTCGHLLILSLGNQVMALDTLRTKDDGTPAIAWTEMVEEAVGSASQRYLFQHGLGNRPVWNGGVVPIGLAGFASSSGFTLGESLVCIKRSRVCTALDPATGQMLWRRGGLATQSTIFGDDRYVLVVSRQSTTARVFRSSDGAELESCTIPPEEQRLTTVGRRILCWEQHEREEGHEPEFLLTMIDPLRSGAERIVWGPYEFPRDAKQQMVDGEAIAVFSPDGKFRLIGLVDGRSIVDTQLELEQPLTDVVVLRRRDRYIVIANNSLIRRDPKRPVGEVVGLKARPIGAAKVYAFDFGGKSLWEKPTAVQDQFLPLGQPQDVPCLTFARAVQELTQGRTQHAKIDILCIDTRSGAIVAHREFPYSGNALEIAAEVEHRKVEIRMQQETFNLTFTDEPVPEGTDSDAADIPSNSLKAIWRAVLKGATVPDNPLRPHEPSLKPPEGEGNRAKADPGSGNTQNVTKGEAASDQGAASGPAASPNRPGQVLVPPPLQPAIRDRIRPSDLVPPQ